MTARFIFVVYNRTPDAKYYVIAKSKTSYGSAMEALVACRAETFSWSTPDSHGSPMMMVMEIPIFGVFDKTFREKETKLIARMLKYDHNMCTVL